MTKTTRSANHKHKNRNSRKRVRHRQRTRKRSSSVRSGLRTHRRHIQKNRKRNSGVQRGGGSLGDTLRQGIQGIQGGLQSVHDKWTDRPDGLRMSTYSPRLSGLFQNSDSFLSKINGGRYERRLGFFLVKNPNITVGTSTVGTTEQNDLGLRCIDKTSLAKVYSNYDPTKQRKYDSFDEIGKGSYGKVYKCCISSQNGNREYVALKKLNYTAKPSQQNASVLDEIYILNLLSGCEHVIRLKDVYCDHPTHNILNIVTELCDTDLQKFIQHVMVLDHYSCFVDVSKSGKTLKELTAESGYIRNVKVSCNYEEDTAKKYSDLLTNHRATIFNQIMAGISELHVKGVVHYDIKPANVFINTSGDTPAIKIGDLGLADVNSETNEFKGTVFYMAPEVVASEVKPDNIMKVDVYSTGVVLCELYFRKDFLSLVGSELFSEYNKALNEKNRLAQQIDFMNSEEQTQGKEMVREMLYNALIESNSSTREELHSLCEKSKDSYTDVIKNCLSETASQRPDAKDVQFSDNAYIAHTAPVAQPSSIASDSITNRDRKLSTIPEAADEGDSNVNHA
jgi:serine/threonine protein kinase